MSDWAKQVLDRMYAAANRKLLGMLEGDNPGIEIARKSWPT